MTDKLERDMVQGLKSPAAEIGRCLSAMMKEFSARGVDPEDADLATLAIYLHKNYYAETVDEVTRKRRAKTSKDVLEMSKEIFAGLMRDFPGGYTPYHSVDCDKSPLSFCLTQPGGSHCKYCGGNVQYKKG